jgi:Raf kinase inhibitor-like YbhB/YbcL family protein
MKLTCRLLVFASILGVAHATLAQTPQKIAVTSPTLKEGETIPRQYTPDGRNDSPPLAWSGVPAAAKELAVVCEDPDAGNPPPFVHWVVYKIPATAKGLPEALPIDSTTKMPADLAGTVQGTNGFRRTLYRGPAPPAGKPHHYHFVVYALDAPIATKPGQVPLTRGELLEAIKGHVIGQGELVALYERTQQEQGQDQPAGRGRGRGVR